MIWTKAGEVDVLLIVLTLWGLFETTVKPLWNVFVEGVWWSISYLQMKVWSLESGQMQKYEILEYAEMAELSGQGLANSGYYPVWSSAGFGDWWARRSLSLELTGAI